MYTFLLILLILTSIVLIAAILLQSGKGQGLSASFGGASSSPDSFIGVRQAGNLLTQISWWGGGVFLVLAFVLQIMSTTSRVPKSVLEGKVGMPAPMPVAPLTPHSAAPAVPLTPAPATPAPATPAPKTPPKK
ncbi:MAG TPA: preprotein translocase subunit SecG [Gemmatimonadaceae bacterium]|jgi:preprotein translocase subunit SecG|nr:preprotein translocase subunit SecG [Gemmatimonadaceae bacterium]